MKKFNLAILRNEWSDDYFLWQKSCERFPDKIAYDVINFTSNNWLDECTRKNYDMYLLKPPGFTNLLKQVYDERVIILANSLQKRIYPSLTEELIYENKRFFLSWLNANELPYPKTSIYFNKEEAINFINENQLPLVIKLNTGASGAGVKIFYNKSEIIDFVDKIFSNKGTTGRWGPNLARGKLLKRGFNYILHPNQISGKVKIYKTRKSDVQKGFVIFQEYIKHDFEWRIVVIGDSYFAHKKLKLNEKASGSLLKKYDNPPLYIFDFAKKIMERFGFYSQAIDAFEIEPGKLLINEMQCIFGQSDPYQMLVNGEPGRYRFVNDKWHFEEGDYTNNECFDLRVKHIISLLENSK